VPLKEVAYLSFSFSFFLWLADCKWLRGIEEKLSKTGRYIIR
jgi:hypothetical protein